MGPTDKLLKFMQEVLTTLTSFDDKGEYNHYLETFNTIKTQVNSELRRRKTPEEVAQILEDFANTLSYREVFEIFAKRITHNASHRSINQHVIRLMFMCIQEEAKLLATGRYDDRNKGAVEACAKLAPIIEDAYLPFI